MNQKKSIPILVTCAGSSAAINIIKALNAQSDYNLSIIAVDKNQESAGLFLANIYHLSPSLAQPDQYISFIISLCKQYKIKAIFPTFSKEILLFSKNKKKFQKIGTQLLISSTQTILLCNNKLEMSNLVKKLKMPVPSIIDNPQPNHFPLIHKPNEGSSSKNIKIINDIFDLKSSFEKNGHFFQNYIKGMEYTVDVLCDKNSNVLFAGSRKRLEVKSGQVTKSITSPNSILKEYAKKICKKAKVVGICNIQFIEKEDKYYFIELNPRYAAGGLMLTVKAGANLPLAALKIMLGHEINIESLTHKSNIIMLRYWEELFIKEKDEFK